METLKLSKANIEECAARAAAVLRSDGVLLYPTDTLYGLGADALSDEAVEKVYALKGRDEKKPIHCVVANLEEAERYGEFNDDARVLAKKFWPGALTLVVKKQSGFDTGIFRDRETIGLRVPNHEFCLALAREFGKPYTTTSANVSGQGSGRTIDAILMQLEHSNILQNIGMLVLDAGELPKSKPSTVVDLVGIDPKILREGAIAAAEIRKALGL